jgi:hypothetical protein
MVVNRKIDETHVLCPTELPGHESTSEVAISASARDVVDAIKGWHDFADKQAASAGGVRGATQDYSSVLVMIVVEQVGDQPFPVALTNVKFKVRGHCERTQSMTFSTFWGAVCAANEPRVLRDTCTTSRWLGSPGHES